MILTGQRDLRSSVNTASPQRIREVNSELGGCNNLRYAEICDLEGGSWSGIQSISSDQNYMEPLNGPKPSIGKTYHFQALGLYGICLSHASNLDHRRSESTWSTDLSLRDVTPLMTDSLANCNHKVPLRCKCNHLVPKSHEER